jgi:hypothetical protein
MTETFEWGAVRQKAVAGFGGETPSAQLEQDVIQHFLEDPLLVIEEIGRVAAEMAAGRDIRSGWAILKSRLDRAAAQPGSEITAEDTGRKAKVEREKRIRNAERWIRNAGIHFDRAREVEDELFGDVGKLRAYAEDDQLRQRLLDLWRQERPRGVRTEVEAAQRAERWKAGQTRLKSEPPSATHAGADRDGPALLGEGLPSFADLALRELARRQQELDALSFRRALDEDEQDELAATLRGQAQLAALGRARVRVEADRIDNSLAVLRYQIEEFAQAGLDLRFFEPEQVTAVEERWPGWTPA